MTAEEIQDARLDRLEAAAGLPPFVPPSPQPDPNALYTDTFDSYNKSAWLPEGNGSWFWRVPDGSGILQQTELSTGDPRKLTLTAVTVPNDQRIRARVRVDSWTPGDMARAGVCVRTDAAGRGYNLLLRDGQQARFLNDGVAWGNSISFPWSVGTWYWMRLAVAGGTLYGKVWADGTPEPANWMLTQTGWTTHASGSVALTAGSGGVASSYDDVTVSAFTAPPPPPSPPPIPPGAVSIVVNFAGTFTDGQKAAFQSAAARWMQVLSGPARTLTITAQSMAIDGQGGILGSSNYGSLSGGLPVTGLMVFDTADLAWMESSGNLNVVIEHEMGHVLGIGTLWSSKGLVTNPSTSDPRFTGPLAKSAYQTIFSDSAATGTPVEGGTISGTSNVHWRESVLGGELMTGYLSGKMQLSAITVQSLADLGYAVNLAAADAYSPTDNILGGPTEEVEGVVLGCGCFVEIPPEHLASAPAKLKRVKRRHKRLVR